LRDGSLQLALMLEPSEQARAGIEFEEIGRYPFFVAMASGHPLARLPKIPPESLDSHSLVVLGRKRNSEYYRILQKIFAPKRPNVSVESDSINSLVTEVEIGRTVAVVSKIFKDAVGKRLVYRPLINTDVQFCIGIARGKNADVTPAGEKLCATIRKVVSQ
jgi:DNA-binding transcriptional LysR family regulator